LAHTETFEDSGFLRDSGAAILNGLAGRFPGFFWGCLAGELGSAWRTWAETGAD